MISSDPFRDRRGARCDVIRPLSPNVRNDTGAYGALRVRPAPATGKLDA